jgi:hypothetical protein
VPARLTVEWHQHQEGGVALHAPHRLFIALQHQDIPGAEVGLGQLFAKPALFAPEAHDNGAIPPSEIDLADGAADEVRLRCHHHLHEEIGEILLFAMRRRRPILRHRMQFDPGRLPDDDDLLGGRAHQEHVTLPHAVFPEGRTQVAAVAKPAHDRDLMPLGTLDLSHGFPKKRRVRQDRDLGAILVRRKHCA